MADIRVKMNSAGARELLNSVGVQAILLEEARAIATRAGKGYEADVQPGKRRAHGMVKTTDHKSRLDNAKNNTLLRALGR